MNFGALLPRVATGLVIVALLAVALYGGKNWLLGLGFVSATLALWELYTMFWPGRAALCAKVSGVLLCALLFVAGSSWSFLQAWTPYLLPLTLSLSMLVLAFAFLLHYGLGKDDVRMDVPALVAAGLLYIPLPLVLALSLLAAHEIIFLLLVVTAADTCAYFVGIAWGTHRVWPRVSPKKSVEGCFGAVAGSVAVCLAFSLYMDTNWRHALPMGVILALAAMFGDFFESALKRAYGVKDSGAILPGHGGVLDRLDSFLFVAPVYLIMHMLWLGR